MVSNSIFWVLSDNDKNIISAGWSFGIGMAATIFLSGILTNTFSLSSATCLFVTIKSSDNRIPLATIVGVFIATTFLIQLQILSSSKQLSF